MSIMRMLEEESKRRAKNEKGGLKMSKPDGPTPSGIVMMYQNGLSMRDIAKRTGVSVWLVHNRLHRLGVEIREEGGAKNGYKGAIAKHGKATQRRAK